MSLLTVIVVLVVVGVLLWALNTYVPMQVQIKTVLNVVVTLFLILWLLQAFGLLGAVQRVRIH